MFPVLIPLCKMAVVRMCVSVDEEVESYLVLKSRFGLFGQDPLA